jgi:monofunctional glycosyltransferase
VNESARRDEPGRDEEPDAAPPSEEAEPWRAAAACAIPVIAPLPPRVPTQVPPWPEETAADAEEEHGTPPISADFAGTGPDEAERQRLHYTDCSSETASQPVADEPRAASADPHAGQEPHVIEPEASIQAVGDDPLDHAAEPAVQTDEDVPPELTEPSASIEPAPEPPHLSPQINTVDPSAATAGSDVNALPEWRGEPPQSPAQSEVYGSKGFTPAPTLGAMRPLAGVNATPDVQDKTAPLEGPRVAIHEEQIWSGPEASEVVERAAPASPERSPDAADAPASPPAEMHEPTEALISPEPRAREPMPYGLAAAGMQSATAWQQRPSSSWPPASPPSDRVGEAAPYLRRAARIAGAVVLMLVATVLLLIVLYRWINPPTSMLMLGQRLTGTEIEQTWVPLRRISPHLVQAVILSEDGAFCRHRGVDWSALGEAMESARGGSTITMQVVKNLFLWPARSYLRKALEIMLAYVVEVFWSKPRVLEIYLNIAEWGPGVFGAEAAARHHFGKAAAQLTAQEAALLAVSLPSPIERQAGYPGWQTRRLANNLLLRMRSVRTPVRCVLPGRGAGLAQPSSRPSGAKRRDEPGPAVRGSFAGPGSERP